MTAREARVLVCIDEDESLPEVLADTAENRIKAVRWLGRDPSERLFEKEDYSGDFATFEGNRYVWNKAVSGSLNDFHDPEKMSDGPELEHPMGGIEDEVIWLINNVDANEAYRILRTARAIGSYFGVEKPMPTTADILHTAIVWERG
jgi:hypothetical protein